MEAPAATAPRIALAPAKALIDEKVSIRVLGLEPDQTVVLRARMRDDLGQAWTSNASFQADEQGVVDVSAQGPISGTYDGLDPMGLFWSMALGPGGKVPFIFAKTDLTPTVMTIAAEVNGTTVASATLERLYVSPDVRRTPVRESGLVGTLLQPGDGAPHPGIIVLGGSEGGLYESLAALFASHGYAALALAYYGMEGLPDDLVSIPLEYFEMAIRWLQAQDGVNGDRLAVTGESRGGELALLLGATFPEIKAVIGLAPGGVMFAGIGRNAAEIVRKNPAAWTHRGAPLPYVPVKFTLLGLISAGLKLLLRRPLVVSSFYAEAMKDQEAVRAATIPVERIHGPVLLISAQDDHIWPSTPLSDIATHRLAQHNHPYPYEHVSYQGAGHVLGVPYLPTTVTEARHPVPGVMFALGGNASDNASAAADSWSRILSFLGDCLGTSA